MPNDNEHPRYTDPEHPYPAATPATRTTITATNTTPGTARSSSHGGPS